MALEREQRIRMYTAVIRHFSSALAIAALLSTVAPVVASADDAVSISNSAYSSVSTGGNTGAQGTAGAAGQDGADGSAGADGRDGADGTAGADGQSGHDGTDGQDGTSGTVTSGTAQSGTAVSNVVAGQESASVHVTTTHNGETVHAVTETVSAQPESSGLVPTETATTQSAAQAAAHASTHIAAATAAASAALAEVSPEAKSTFVRIKEAFASFQVTIISYVNALF